MNKLKIVCIILFSFQTKFSLGQFDSWLKRKQFEAVYGYRIPQTNYYGQFNTTNNFNTNKPIQFFGLGIRQHLAIGAGHGTCQLSYMYFIPTDIFIQDTIKSRLSGFSLNYSVGKSIFRKAKAIDIMLGLGLNAGLSKIYISSTINKCNPFISPKAFLSTTFYIGKRLYFSIIAEYDYDITKPNWLKDNTFYENNNLNTFRQTSYTLMTALGLHITKQK